MRILNVKTDAVTRGVLDKNVTHEPDVIEVTYVDDSNTPHTIFPHRNGPFANPEKAVAAHQAGTLHSEDHEIDAPDTPAPPQGEVFE